MQHEINEQVVYYSHKFIKLIFGAHLRKSAILRKINEQIISSF